MVKSLVSKVLFNDPSVFVTQLKNNNLILLENILFVSS